VGGFEQRQLARPLRLRAESTIAKLRANFNTPIFGDAPRSSADRGRACREVLANVCRDCAEARFHGNVQSACASDCRHFTGLALATLLFYAVTPTAMIEFALVVVIVFVFRCFGPAHYGVLTASLTAYIVVIFALAGQIPSEVMRERALHTVLV
jgi:hypothetical protein